MFVEGDGGAEATGSVGTPDDMLITVEGEEYSADINFDLNEDGVADTAVIEHADGSVQAFHDEDGDGEADEYLKIDAQGNTIAHAEYDEATGDWVDVGGAATETPDDDPGTQASTGGTITADMPDGEVEVGPATVDTNHDGVNDTAVVTDSEGNTMAFTDIDGDGEADVATIIDETGSAVAYEHTGDGEWTQIDSASPAGSSDNVWGSEGRQPLEGVARIDNVTGQWISQN